MSQTFTRRALSLLLLSFSIGAVSLPADALKGGPRPLAATIWPRTELYFGTNRPDGSTVSDTEFQQFVDEHVTPRFPDGLTLLSGYGQFLNSTGVIEKEQSKVLILFYPEQTVETNRKIQLIRDLYKYKFQQESVLRADSLSLISF